MEINNKLRCRHCGCPIAKKEPTEYWNGYYHTDRKYEGSAWCSDGYGTKAEPEPETEVVKRILERYEV